MTYNFKKDYLKNWDLQPVNEKPMVNINNDDDQETYISERSSIASSNELNQISNPFIKHVSTPPPSPPVSLPQKQPHTLRYPYNELPENGIPAATQFQLQRKEDKKKKKELRKAPPGQGSLALFPDAKQPEYGSNYYPYWYYYKVKNPDWIMRHRQTTDGQLIPHESVDPSQYAHQPALTTSSIKPQQHPRKSRHNGVPITQSNHDKQRYDRTEKNSPPLSYVTAHENFDNNHQQQSPSSKQYIPLKDAVHNEHQEQPIKRTISQQRHKLKTENDWTDHYMQSIANKSIQDSNSLIVTPNSLTNRSKNRSKITDKNSLISDTDGNNKHHHNHNHHHHQSQPYSHNSPSIPSHHNHHHNHHLHIRRRPPSGTYVDSEFHVVDVSFKRSDRSPYFQPARDSFHSPINNSNPYLPPITRDHRHHHHQHNKTNISRFPSEYYGTLARQSHGKDWEESLEVPKIYKPDPQTRLHGRYLNNVVDKRLAA